MKILVIDDDIDILNAIESILKKEGYEIDKASSVLEGKIKIDTVSYNLVISDIMLPHWGGFDLVDAVKENPFKKNTPVIVITGMERDILDSTYTFADFCLMKPFTGKQLIEVVNTVMKDQAKQN